MATEDESVPTDSSDVSEPSVSVDEKTIPHAIQLHKDVKQRVEELHATGIVRERIVAALTEAEISKRTDKLSKAFTKRDEMSRNLDKIRPDSVTLDGKGKVLTEGYTKPKFEERRKALEELNKLDTAIGKAVDKADYEPLGKFIGG